MAVSKRIRYEILRRDNNTCRYCHATDSPLTVDHVIPVALGGSDDPSNLVAACKDCNAGKTSTSPDAPVVAQVADDAIRWAAAIAQAAAAEVADYKAMEKHIRAFDRAWKGEGVDRSTRPSGWQDSVRTWLTQGMPIELLIASAQKALRNTLVAPSERWRYFCGIAWKRLSELQEAATASLAPVVEKPKQTPAPHLAVVGDRDQANFDAGCKAAENYVGGVAAIIQMRALHRLVDAGGFAWVDDFYDDRKQA